MVAQPCEYIKTHWIVYFEFYIIHISYVNCILISENNRTFSEKDLGHTATCTCWTTYAKNQGSAQRMRCMSKAQKTQHEGDSVTQICVNLCTKKSK